MTDPRPETVRDFYAHMADEYGATVKPKASAQEMQLAGAFLGALGIVDREAFIKRFVTTIGSTVYLPFTPGEPGAGGWDLWQQMETFAHECQHIKQRATLGGIRYDFLYLSSKARRTHLESEAYAVNCELYYWRHGYIEREWPARRASSMASYGVSEADVGVLTTYLQITAAAVHLGGIYSHAGRTALNWLDRYAPELRAPNVVSRVG